MLDYEKASLMAGERNEIRSELVELEKTLFRVLLAMGTALAAVAGIIFKENGHPENYKTIIIGLMQIEYLMGFLSVLCLYNMLIHSGYLMAVEDNINAFSQSKITIWERSMSAKLLLGGYGLYFWMTLTLVLFFIFWHVFITYKCFCLVDSHLVRALLVGEALTSVMFIVLMFVKSKKVYAFAKKEFGSAPKNDTTLV